jgi:hypothetical protein
MRLRDDLSNSNAGAPDKHSAEIQEGIFPEFSLSGQSSPNYSILVQSPKHAIGRALYRVRHRNDDVKFRAMETSGFRHQGFIYDGSTSRPAPAVAAVIKERLAQKHRCLYFDSKPMVADLQADLARIGVDVNRETSHSNLVFSSHLGHLKEDHTFDIDEMITTLESALAQALQDGYAGLWASGDIAWEFGPKEDLTQLVEYETRLEAFVSTHEKFSGICIYDASVLPADAVQTGHETHPVLFSGAAESRLNPAFRPRNEERADTSPEDIVEVSLTGDLLSLASSCASSEGITLEEFVSRAIVEKLQSFNRKNPTNGST